MFCESDKKWTTSQVNLEKDVIFASDMKARGESEK